jgi:hypothetical protein
MNDNSLNCIINLRLVVDYFRRQWRLNTGLSLNVQSKIKLPEKELKVCEAE